MQAGKRQRGDLCASSHSEQPIVAQQNRLPIVDVSVNNIAAKALVDTGCTAVVVKSNFVEDVDGECVMQAFDGREVQCRGELWIIVQVANESVNVKAKVVSELVDGIDLVIGMDLINHCGGVSVYKGVVQFGLGGVCCNIDDEFEHEKALVGESSVVHDRPPPLNIEDPDFRAVFDGEKWVVEWLAKTERPVLTAKIGCYERTLSDGVRAGFDAEVQR